MRDWREINFSLSIHPVAKEYGIAVRLSLGNHSESGRYWMWQSDSWAYCVTMALHWQLHTKKQNDVRYIFCNLSLAYLFSVFHFASSFNTLWLVIDRHCLQKKNRCLHIFFVGIVIVCWSCFPSAKVLRICRNWVAKMQGYITSFSSVISSS